MFTLSLSKEDLLVIDKALQQLPFYVAAPLLDKINTQLQEQQNALHDL
jgi:hypothetical protein